MLIENVFPPIPSELIMPLAGFMVAQNELTFLGTTLAGMAGSVLGALPFYYAGKKLGEERVKRFADQYGRWLTVSRQDVDRASRRRGGSTSMGAPLCGCAALSPACVPSFRFPPESPE